MTDKFALAMSRATDRVRAGDPFAATKIIQETLHAKTAKGTPPLSGKRLIASDKTPPSSAARRDALPQRMKKWSPQNARPASARTGAVDPDLPQGARFDGGTFSCAAGRRDYKVYVPHLATARPQGMIMMLHGCTQTPDDFARGTGMNKIADDHGLILVYPAQSRGANMQTCWNWFGPADQERGGGEPALLAALATEIRDRNDVPETRMFVAGLSAGAAMAVILGRTYPDVFRAVGAHSGLPYKAARDVPSAFSAMGSGASNAANIPASPVSTIVFHGDADSTVHPANGQRIADGAAVAATQIVDSGTDNGRSYTRTTSLSETGQSLMEHWQINGQGHAWSGGNASGSYTDPKGPDASAQMVRFFLNSPSKDA